MTKNLPLEATVIVIAWIALNLKWIFFYLILEETSRSSANIFVGCTYKLLRAQGK